MAAVARADPVLESGAPASVGREARPVAGLLVVGGEDGTAHRVQPSGPGRSAM